jgi:histidinol-phosphate phosphatase family protein
MKKAVFLDRDGVINRKAAEGEYVTRWADFMILPGVAEGIRLLRDDGFQVIVATNQRCVAKGLLSAAGLDEIHENMRLELAKANAAVDAVYCCPHDIVPPCSCRKPAPGMLLRAAEEHGIELHESWMIGDSPTDIKAGILAGCKTVLVAEHPRELVPKPSLIVGSLLEAARLLTGK